MIAAFLLAATAATAVDAERAFERDAQRIGQWSAFRKWADRDAVMFDPQAVWAYNFLKDRKNPPKSVTWRPASSFVSCDGRTAVNTGPAFAPDGKFYGYFTTVWQRKASDWRWVYDGTGTVVGPKTRTGAPRVTRAACRPKAPGAPVIAPPPLNPREARNNPEDNGRGESADRSLGWDWKVEKDGRRRLRVFLWNGLRYAQVLYNDVPPG